ncbi:MAG: hypothetical protein FH756_18870 [Firmicutes bacterium]|nr:hypothetical protein [Bacillota bacterium]
MDKKIVLEDATVFIKQVTMEQYIKKEMPFDVGELWQYRVAKKLPDGLQIPFLGLCYFYSRPYEFHDDSALLKVKGIMAYDSSNDYELHELYQMRIYIDETNYYGRGMGARHAQDDNFHLFRVRGEEAPPDTKHLKLIIDRKDGDRVKVLSFEPTWETKTYNTLQERPPEYGFDPWESVFKIFHVVKYGNEEKLQELVLPKLRGDFPWGRIKHNYWESIHNGHFTYMEEYQGFEDVFKHTVVFCERDDSETDKITEQPITDIAEQNLYLIDTGEVWRLIEVGPVEELPR